MSKEEAQEPNLDEVIESEGEPNEPEYTPEEVQAMEHGWAPKEEWKGDESDWVSAKEFNRRGELFGKIKNLERDRDALRQASRHMKDLLAKAKQTEYSRAVADLKAQKKQAAEEGETTKMLEIDDQIEELTVDHNTYQQEIAAAEPAPADTNTAFVEWQRDNQWYTADADMRLFADSVGQQFAQANPAASIDEMFQAVDRQVRKAYPEKFQNPRRSSPSKVESTSSTTNTEPRGSKSKFTARDLNDQQREIMKTMTRSGVMTEKEYIQELVRIGEIG